jgi:hypothetical protein
MSTNAAFTDHVPSMQSPHVQSPGTHATGMQSDADAELERWYAQRRRWPVERDVDGTLWLMAGTDFDVVEVPEEAGRDALGRLIGYEQAALAPGPVALTGADRCGFFVTPGSGDDLPELLDWLDWGGIDLGLRAYGAGDRIPAPRQDRWLHDPLAVPPEVIALLATIAECCSRYALSRRAAVRGPAWSC